MTVLLRLVCAFVGHVLTDWHDFTWVVDTPSWSEDGARTLVESWTTNRRQQSRWCARCDGGYEQRWAA